MVCGVTARAAFHALHGIVRVVPPVATEEMVNAWAGLEGDEQESITAALIRGDLTAKE